MWLSDEWIIIHSSKFSNVELFIRENYKEHSQEMNNKQKLLLMIWMQKNFRKKIRKRRKYWYKVLSCMHRFHVRKKISVMVLPLCHQEKMKTPRLVWCYPREERWFENMWTNRLVENFEGGRWKADFRHGDVRPYSFNLQRASMICVFCIFHDIETL